MNKVAMMTILLMLPLSNCLGEDLSEDSDTETVVGTCGDDLFVEYESHWGCKFEVEFKQEVTLNWWIDVPDVDWDIDVYFMNDYNYDRYIEDEGLWGECEEFVYYEKVSMENINNETLGEKKISLTADEYYFVLDNKSCTGAQPLDDIRVDYFFEITRLQNKS